MKRIKDIFESKCGRPLIHGIGLLSLILLLGGHSLFVARAIDGRHAADSQRLKKLRELTQGVTRLRSECSILKNEIEIHADRVAKLPAQFLEHTEDPEFVFKITKVADTCGLKIKSFNHSNNEQLADCQRMNMELNCTGTHSQFCAFVDALSATTRIVRFENLVITAGAHHQPCSITAHLAVYSNFGDGLSDQSSTQSENGE